MSISIDMHCDFGPLYDKVAKAPQTAVMAVTMAARRDSEPYVPYETGALRRSADTESDLAAGRLVYGSAAVPYARAQYYGCPHKTWPGTTTEWVEAAKEGNMEGWTLEGAEAVKELFS